MAAIPAATREAPAGPSQSRPAQSTTAANDQATGSRTANARREMPARVSRLATDDEILELDSAPRTNRRDSLPEDAVGDDAPGPNAADAATGQVDRVNREPEHLRAALDANPELRRAWQDAQSYRETFASPEEARAATAVLADVDRMDALFYSQRPEDHAALARMVAGLDPRAFASLAQAMNGLATEAQRHGENRAGNRRLPAMPTAPPVIPNVPAPFGSEEAAVGSDVQKQIPRQPQDGLARDDTAAVSGAPTQAQTDFFQATNAAAVQSVLDAIETQVERLLPEGVPKSARNRVVGEIYRELDTTLRSNRQLAQQMREAFRSGALDAEHQRALVSLVTGRARQALPGVAKRVLNEWTSTIVAANQDRRSRQRVAERRVDIAGSSGGGSEGQRSTTPRDINYAHMSDTDILNL